MLASLLLLSHLANAGSEVGSVKKLGVGVTTGDPYIGVTGKYWVSDDSGFAVYVGSAVVYHTAKVSFQSNFLTVGEDWSFGRLPIYWHADAVAGLYTVPNYVAPVVAVGGGAGTALQFQAVPAEVFGELGLAAGYNGFCANNAALVGAACFFRPLVSFGGRWYF